MSKLAAVEIENFPFAEQVDEADLAMVQAVLQQQAVVKVMAEQFNARAKEVQELERQLTTAALEVQGADKFVHNHVRGKYHVEGNFTVDDKGKIIRQPTAEVMP